MHKKRRRLRKTVKKTIRILLIIFIVVLTGLSYSLVTDADDYNSNDYPAYQNTVSIDTQSYGKLSLSVTADEHILPENTNISLKEITNTASDEYKNIETSLEDDANSNNDLLSGVLLYDLSFTDTDSHEIPSINDHDIHVYGSYEKYADPLTENDNESVSVKLISKDNAYTVTDLSEDNYSSVDTDENNAVENMSMTIHGSTYYALIWHKKPEITVHAVDENNNEFIPSNTVQISEDTYINDFTPSVDGYTLTSITGNNTDITKVKAENGKLYFHNGTEWKETSDNNVYFHYVSNKTQQPAEQETVEETAQPDTEETPVPEAVTDTIHQLTETSDDNKYTVTVSYGDDAGLPEGTSLQVTTIDSDKEEYANAKKAVAASKQVDEDTLGMDALDITLLDSDGTKVEPSESSNIQVSISINDLPDNIDSVEIHHITDEDKPETTEDKASAVAENVDVVNNTANAEFNVNSFSTFTITWTNDNTRIGNVVLHYIDSNGLEHDLQDSETVDLNELSKNNGGIVDINKTWGSKSISLDEGEASDVAYSYDHASIGTRKGTVITGVKVETSSNGYRLYYTSDEVVNESSDWKVYKDSVSKEDTNNANIYLIYTNADRAIIHYMVSTAGGKNQPIYTIKDSEGNPTTSILDTSGYSGTTSDNWSQRGKFDLFQRFNNAVNLPSGYSFTGENDGSNKTINLLYTTENNPANTTFRYLKNVNGVLYYGGSKFSRWTQASNHVVDIYVSCTVADTFPVTVHHIDKTGKTIAADTTVSASKNGSLNADNFKSTSITSNVLGAYYNWNGSSETSSKFDSLSYSTTNDLQWQTNVSVTGTTSQTVSGGVKEVWVQYDTEASNNQLTVHYVDEDGNELKNSTTLSIPQTVAETTEGYTGYTFNNTDYSVNNYSLLNIYLNDLNGNHTVAGARVIYYVSNDSTPIIKSYYSTTAYGSSFPNTDKQFIEEKNGEGETAIPKWPWSENDSLVRDVYLVYRKTINPVTFNVHYVYTDGSGTSQINIPEESSVEKNNSTFTLSNDETTVRLTTTRSEESAYKTVNPSLNGQGGIVAENVTKDNKDLYYLSTRIGSVDGFLATSVYVSSDGTVMYQTASDDSTPGFAQSTSITLSQVGSTDRWSASQKNGRNYILTKTNNNYSLNDSQHGSINLNFISENTNGVQTYSGTFHGEKEIAVYRLQHTSAGYVLYVENYVPSSSKDIYVVYTDKQNTNTGMIYIDNDIQYTGMLNVKLANEVDREVNPTSANGGLEINKTTGIATSKYGTASNITYTWHRVETPLKEDGTPDTDNKKDITLDDSQRHLTGAHYNVAANAKDRTWLDVEADEGENIWSYGTQISYYVTLSYDLDNNGTTNGKSYQSEPIVINYYGQLENGSFERASQYAGDSNDYLSHGGIWKTTANDAKKAIEIVNGVPNENSNLGTDGGYNWTRNDPNFNLKSTESVARDEKYFAELCANNAGALYQDVITHPNETLSYGLSHRARGSKEGNYTKYNNMQYDTMYLVIMPTKLAMTSGSGGTELKNQTDLEAFINDHGGFDSSIATHITDQITYQDQENGILIRKISSTMNWHDVSVTNGYTAKGGLTRFFFVAASTIGDYARRNETTFKDAAMTTGNFLDRVYFTQELPEPEGFNLTVSKTFRNLTQDQIASLASNNSDKPFTISITNTYTQSNTQQMNDALENAELQFTAFKTGDNAYSFTPTAYQYQKKENDKWIPVTKEEYNAITDKDSKRKYDIFSEAISAENQNKKNSFNVITTTDGTTFTWTFTDQHLPEGAQDQMFNYTVSESNDDISGLITTQTYSLDGGNIQSGTSGTIGITQGHTGTYAFTNSYAENMGNPSQITVEKTFTGVTRTTVERMLAGYDYIDGEETKHQAPFTVTVKKTEDDTGNTLTNQPSVVLSPSNTGDIIVLGSGDTAQHANISYRLSEDADSGKVILTWVIQEVRRETAAANADDIWMGGPGTYTVSENNYNLVKGSEDSEVNTLSSIEINGRKVANTDTGASGTVHVGEINNTDYSPVLNVRDGSVISNPANDITVSSDINLIIAQANNNSYVVWTKETAGANLRQSIVKFINSTDGLGKDAGDATASLSNVSFRSGAIPGTLKYDTTHSDTTFTYDGGTSVNFTNGQILSWNKAFITIYQIPESNYGNDGDQKNSETEARITNTYQPLVRIKKVNADNPSESLNNAEFKLYKLVNNGKLYLQSDNTWTSASTSAKTFTTTGTDGNGNPAGLISLGNLPIESEDTTYYLEEVNAPDGYNKLVDSVSFVVKTDGTVTGDAITFPDSYYVITITNTPGSVLPGTGGIGTYIFYIAGGLIVVIAVLLLVKRKNKKE